MGLGLGFRVQAWWSAGWTDAEGGSVASVVNADCHSTTFLPHTDSRNYRNTFNSLVYRNDQKTCTGGELWVHYNSGSAVRQVKPDVRRKPLVFNARLYHGTEPWSGERQKSELTPIVVSAKARPLSGVPPSSAIQYWLSYWVPHLWKPSTHKRTFPCLNTPH